MKYIGIILFLVNSFLCSGQQIKLTGYINDENGLALGEVLVESSTKNFTILTYSNKEGYFQLALPDTSLIISFSKAGYKSFSTQIVSDSHLSIVLPYSELSQMSLEEILRTRVNTVSLKEEDIAEAPGIVSVITGEEIRDMGIRTVREALTLIPGFAPFQNDDEQILAVRGVFATTSQKILFMRNGHSLNEGNLDIPQMEYSISMENIKKIEIIRGPGASIYGNSAFAAVVNIITLDYDEGRIKTSIGNNGFFQTDAYISRHLKDQSNFIAWGRFANIRGEEKNVSFNGGPLYGQVDGTYKTYSYPLNYDAGFSYSSKNIETSLSLRRHNYKTYWTIPGEFTNVDSLFWQPMLLQNSVHYNVDLDFELNERTRLHLQNYIDYSTLSNYRLIGNVSDSTPHGIIQANEWNVLKSGANYYGSWQYHEHGNLVIGLAYEYRKYLDSWVMSNRNDTIHMSLPQEYYPVAQESRIAGYMQANHSVSDWFKLDIGFRYDLAEEFKSSFNPRLALIFYPSRKIILKAIYTKAFQAPGYSYRNANNEAAEFSGSLEVLQPEDIKTYQFSSRYLINSSNFIEVAFYYNQLKNMIARRPGSAYYSNFGKLSSYGLEVDANFNLKKHTLFARYALLLPDTAYMDEDFKRFYIYDNLFKNLPQHIINAGIILRIAEKINFSLYSQYNSAYLASNNEVINDRITINSTIRFINLIKNLEINMSVYNLTNQEYKLGDPSIIPLPQPGRWYSISLIASFQP